MKRASSVLVLAAMVLLVPSTGFAIDSVWGIKGGVTFANFVGDDAGDVAGVIEFNYKFGFAAGFFIEFFLYSMIAIQPEALFILKGSRVELFGVEADHLNLYYVDFPILIKIYPIQSGINVFAGPFFSLNLWNRESLKGDLKDAVSKAGGDTKIKRENIHNVDFGFVVGAGFDFEKVVIDGRYSLGFIAIDDSGFDRDWKNSVFSFLVGFKL
jgi:hypothetical protein